ncbi:zinc finger CW-type PWWP domain protein 2-like [Styela clava]
MDVKRRLRSCKRETTPIAELGSESTEQTDKTSNSCSPASSSTVNSQHWVQCESTDCLKWRLLPRDEFDQLDEELPWYCHMNKNVLFSSCDTVQEKSNSEQKLKRHGLQYRFSLLPEGSLVWARLAGYCRWPSIICCEPAGPEFVIKDEDGDPFSYHVEFLGTKHSVAWVNYKKIDAYGNLNKQEALETCSQPFSQISMNRFHFGPKRRKKKFCVTRKKKVGAQLAEQLQFAIDEADALIDVDKEQRLESCKYRYNAALVESQKLKECTDLVGRITKRRLGDSGKGF